MDLTQEQILEMTETIARACGMDARIATDSAYGFKYVSTNFGKFRPEYLWDDAMIAAHELEVGRIHIDPDVIGRNLMWLVRLGRGSDDDSYAYIGLHTCKLTAFLIALHEAAKSKLEGYRQEENEDAKS